MRREVHSPGHDQRVLKFFSQLLPVTRIGEDVLERLEVFLRVPLALVFVGVSLATIFRFGCVTLATGLAVGEEIWPALLLRHRRELDDVGVYHLELGVAPQLAPEEPSGFEVRIHLVTAPGDETSFG